MPAEPGAERRRLRISGVVQGVGFRPFVYRRAVALGLTGWVANDAAGVVAEVEGPADAVDRLCRDVATGAPPPACVEAVEHVAVAPLGDHGFEIRPSAAAGSGALSVGPDVATCAACLAEVDDPGDRRHRYPFTSCTGCGPRYTILTRPPYDRAATTMAPFPLCPACRQEHTSPEDRRFHAEANACPVCGPGVGLLAPDGSVVAEGDVAVERAAALLRGGRVLALKGIGGYHLACDAGDAAAVERVRAVKRRDQQPFAVMVASVEAADELVVVDEATAALLSSPRRPIVLAPRRPGAPVCGAVAPSATELGVLLPYTPLHHLLARGAGRPLVMTSGNAGGEPIVADDDEARRRLAPLVAGLLVHDRRIHVRCDDSVVRVSARGSQVLRRSRGYVPEAIALPVAAERPVLAVGAALKSTVAVARGGAVVASHHLGDLDSLAGYQGFVAAIEHLCRLTGVAPEVVAHDLHPDIRSTIHALDLGLPAVGVQHHHAHVASCLVDNAEAGPVLGVAFDGLGLGSDGTLWGGELLLADLRSSIRVGHLRPVGMPGGEAAIREPWRMALAWVHEAAGPQAARRLGPDLDARWPGVLAVVEARRSLVTTSVGRLFDAVAALLGVRSTTTYEGQAAVELEALADGAPRGAGRSAPAGIAVGTTADGAIVLDPAPHVADLVARARSGEPRAALAASFHDALADATVEAAAGAASRHGVTTVALTGGVFQNRRLADAVTTGLAGRGLRVLVHRRIPPNDGGISIGQAAVAAARQRTGPAAREPSSDRAVQSSPMGGGR